jgi:Nucleotidyltransferase domain
LYIWRVDLAHPYSVISNRLDGAALVVLAGTSQPLTGHQVARLAKEGTQQGIGKALQRLVEQGIAIRTEAGNAHLYVLNREHLAAPLAEELANLRPALFARIGAALEGWNELPPVHASVFGSASRDDGTSDSDVDIFLVRPRSVDENHRGWRSQVDQLAADVRAWTGNRAAISELPEDDLQRLARDRPPIVTELVDDAVTLIGPNVTALLARDA